MASTQPTPIPVEWLFRQSPACTWLLNRDGQFGIVYGNSAHIFGREPGSGDAPNFADLFAPEARHTWLNRLKRAFAGETLSAGVRFAANGPSYSVTLFPVRSPEGETVFVGGIAHAAAERDLALRMLQSQERDRARISQLLHDHVGQYLSAIGLQLDLLSMDLAEIPSPLSGRTSEIQEMLERLMTVVRDFSQQMNPAVAERVGMRAALDRLAGSLRTDFEGTVRVLVDPTAQVPPAAAGALYSIAQEASGNAVRHAGCSIIEILLKSLRSGPALEIRDNGKGFDAADRRLQGRGLGLLLMEEHAGQADIELSIESEPGKGTVVRALCRSVDGLAAGEGTRF